MSSPIAIPAGFVPAHAIAFSDTAGAVCVDADHPLPTSEPSFRGAVPITVGVEQPPRRGIAIVCTGAGTVRLRLADDSDIAVPVTAGLSILPFQARTVIATGTTATASFYNLV